jgi:Ethanolamine utilization protein EutJ (predicted chaperonin)
MYDEAKGDLNAAVEKISNYVANFPTIADEFVRIGARSLLNEVGQKERKRIETAQSCGTKTPHTMSPAVHAAQRRAQRQGLIVTETLFDMPFKWQGVDTKLGDLSGTQVVEIGNGFLGQGVDMVRKGRWLISAGERAGSKTMRAALTAADLAKIKAEAEGMTV